LRSHPQSRHHFRGLEGLGVLAHTVLLTEAMQPSMKQVPARKSSANVERESAGRATSASPLARSAGSSPRRNAAAALAALVVAACSSGSGHDGSGSVTGSSGDASSLGAHAAGYLPASGITQPTLFSRAMPAPKEPPNPILSAMPKLARNGVDGDRPPRRAPGLGAATATSKTP
jgi:hypothetical protein